MWKVYDPPVDKQKIDDGYDDRRDRNYQEFNSFGS